MTPEQEKEQMISFTYGNAKMSNPYVTCKMVEDAAMTIDPKFLEEDFEGKIHATVKLEDLEEETIQEALTCIREAILKCRPCCLDYEADRKTFMEEVELQLRKVFCV